MTVDIEKRELIENLNELNGNLNNHAISNYNNLLEVIRYSNNYYSRKLSDFLNEIIYVVYNENIEEGLKKHTSNLSSMRMFVKDVYEDDIYLLVNDKLQNFEKSDFEIIIHDLQEELERL